MLRPLLLALALAALPLLPATSAEPEAARVAVEGVDYERLPEREATHDPAKIEVLEIFNYGCIHCFHLAPYLEDWKSQQAVDVDLQYLPAPFSREHELFARGFFAVQALGQLDATHARLFDALWNQQVPIRSLGDLADLYARLGVDRARFYAEAQSAENRAAVDAAKEKIVRLRVDSTPTIIVDGRYRVLMTQITTQEDLLKRVDAIVALERAVRERRKAR